MNIIDSIRAPRSVKPLIVLGLVLLVSASAAQAAPLGATLDSSAQPSVSRTTLAWLGMAGDGRWSNPENWEGQRLPGPGDIIRFDADSPDARVDVAFGGTVGGVELESGFAGTVSLERTLLVAGDLTMAGGMFAGEQAFLEIHGRAKVSGGLFTTPSATMRAERMEVRAPGVVRLGVNGKLNLAGDGTPLSGDGLLDTTTNQPNSIEYTGPATSDLLLAGPLSGAGGLRWEDEEGKTLNTARREPRSQLDVLRFGRAGGLVLNTPENYLVSAVLDSVHGYAYFGTSCPFSPCGPGIVVKMRLSDFTRVGALTLNSGENTLSSAVIDPGNGYAYFGTFSGSGRVIKVQLSNLTRVGALPLDSGETSLMSAVVDSANGHAYFGTGDTYRGVVIKVRLWDFTRVGALLLNSSEGPLTSAVIDAANGNAYFGTSPDWSPGQVIKIRLSDFTRVGTVSLNPGEGNLTSAVLDSGSGYAYFGTNTNPGQVIKIGLSDFSRVDALTLTEEGSFTSAVIDQANGHAYFAMGTWPSKVVKINLSDFSRVDALTLSDTNVMASAVLDSVRGYAYFGTGINTPAAQVIRVRLSDFSPAGVLTLNTGETWLSSALIDLTGSYAYFGTGTEPGKVVKIRLSDFTWAGTLALGADESYLYSAVVDPGNGYAYFGTGTNPGIVVRVGLSSAGQAQTVLASSANPSRIGQPVTFTATISAMTTGTPTGTVTFRSDGSVLCSDVPLTTGQAVCASSCLPVGAHTITARYSGDSSFDPSGGDAHRRTGGQGIRDYDDHRRALAQSFQGWRGGCDKLRRDS